MLAFIGMTFLVALFICFMPFILALAMTVAGVVFCLLMLAICWVRELFTSPKKPNR